MSFRNLAFSGLVAALAAFPAIATGAPEASAAAESAARPAVGGSAPSEIQASPAGARPLAFGPSRPEAAGPDDLVGVGVHELDPTSVQLLGDLGVRHIRTTLYWGLWVDDPGYRRRFTAGIRRAVDAGLEPLVVVHQQPRGGYADRERVYRAFAEFVADRAADLPEVRYWQLWNEMDVAFTDVFGAGHGDVSLRERGRNYGRMLRLAYPAIKRASPAATVVTGGVASDIDGGFIQGIYDVGGTFDVLAIHSYGFPVPPSLRDRGRQARAIMAANGDDRPLWNTEFGMEAAVVPPDWPASPADIDRYHLEAWQGSARLNERERIYERIYGHVLQQDGDLSFDLVRRDGRPRPAFVWLKGYFHSQTTGPSTVVGR